MDHEKMTVDKIACIYQNSKKIETRRLEDGEVGGFFKEFYHW
jgi:hypothetical protein